MKPTYGKKVLVTLIALGVGVLHFLTGENYHGPYPVFVNGYLIDILLPMSLVLLLGLVQFRVVQTPLFRATSVFLFGCAVETSQLMGYPVFGSTFDPLDILAYAGGVLLGIFLDMVIFPRLLLLRNENSSSVS
jgi:hypothetical protein